MRTLLVEAVEPVPARAGRVHATLASPGREAVDVVHVWTSDPELAARLVPGRAVVLTIAPATP